MIGGKANLVPRVERMASLSNLKVSVVRVASDCFHDHFMSRVVKRTKDNKN